jgi:benzil reductase ((S)-benzoin forming)
VVRDAVANPAPNTQDHLMSSNRPIALVTGTSRGLGAAIAQALLDAGWRVHGCARGDADQTLRGDYHHTRVDLSDIHAATAVLGELLKAVADARPSRVGIVNNAGTLTPMALGPEIDGAALDRALTLNVTAPLWLMGAAVRAFAETPLRIVNIGSGAATSAYPGWTAYCASKAALRMGAMVLGAELEESTKLRGRDVAIVDYAPGVVQTEMQTQIRAMDAADFPRVGRFVEMFEAGQLLTAEQPAAAILQLLSSDALPSFCERSFYDD